MCAFSPANIYNVGPPPQAMLAACNAGDVATARMIWKSASNVARRGQLYWDLYEALCAACLAGRTEVVKWIASTRPQLVHTDQARAFAWACIGNNVDIADWLWQTHSVNVRALHDWQFQHACFNGCIDIVAWFLLHGLGPATQQDFRTAFVGTTAPPCKPTLPPTVAVTYYGDTLVPLRVYGMHKCELCDRAGVALLLERTWVQTWPNSALPPQCAEFCGDVRWRGVRAAWIVACVTTD
jgi:hypothetical protein